MCACVIYIACITQVTLEVLNYTLFIYDRWHSVVQFFGWQTQAGWWCLLLGSDPRVVCLEQLKDRSLEIADTSSTHLWYCVDGKPRATFTLIFLGICPFPYDRHHPTTRLAENLHWLLWMIERNCHCSVSCSECRGDQYFGPCYCFC